MVGIALCFVACATGGPVVATASIVVAGMLQGVVGPVIFAVAQTLAGPTASGKWVGVQNALGKHRRHRGRRFVTGVIVDRTGHFAGAFVLAGTIVALGALAWTVVISQG